MECMWTISGIASVQHIQPKDSGIRTKCSQATQHESGPPRLKKRSEECGASVHSETEMGDPAAP